MELQSEGKCIFCNEYFSQKEIGRHLATHLKLKEKEDKAKQTDGYNHIVVEADVMFLHLLVKSSCEMEEIDNFLRAIWLECCGHESGFHIKRGEEIEMDEIVGDVLSRKTIIQHDYDYGTTTRTSIKCIKVYALDFDDDDIILLSRNEPLKIMCSICDKKPATVLCSICVWNEDAYFCKICAKKHAKTCEDFDDYASMNVVNSPRMGECGYEGGTFDKERDGVYKERKKTPSQ
jgi:hypothetical protein